MPFIYNELKREVNNFLATVYGKGFEYRIKTIRVLGSMCYYRIDERPIGAKVENAWLEKEYFVDKQKAETRLATLYLTQR